MTTEYPLQEGDDPTELARDLLDQAAHPDEVRWAPRPDVTGGGVFVLGDEGIAQRTRDARRARNEEAERATIAETLADDGEGDEDDGEDEPDSPATGDEPATPAEDGKPLTAAQKRAAKKRAAQAQQDIPAPAEVQPTEQGATPAADAVTEPEKSE